MARERGLYRRKDSRFWWIGLVLPDGRRVCQSTGCINRTDAESYLVRLKNEAIEAKQQGLLGIFVWQQAVVRYLEEFVDKRSLSDDRDHLKKLDPYLRSLKLDAIDMAVLQPFIRDRKSKDGVSNATVNRALEAKSVVRAESRDASISSMSLFAAHWGGRLAVGAGTCQGFTNR